MKHEHSRIQRLIYCFLLLVCGVKGLVAKEPATDWMTWPSTYTHDPVRGMPVDQYALPAEPVSPARTDFQRSGFRHYRSTLQAGQSADNMHIVEQWGRPVEPYEQWRFPFRPYGVPYDAWGPPTPYGIINGNWNWGGLPPGYGGVPSSPGPPFPGYPSGPMLPPASNGFPLVPPYQPAPWFDGTYPAAPPLTSPFR